MGILYLTNQTNKEIEMTNQRNARIYQRVSSQGQDLTRQQKLIDDAIAAGFYIAGTYSEKASGTTEDRPELQRMISDLKPGDTIIAEHLDRITRLPMDKAEALMARIAKQGAKVSVPGLIDLSSLDVEKDSVAEIVIQSAQTMLLKLALYQCRQDWTTRNQRQAEGIAVKKARDKSLPKEERTYQGRKADTVANAKIVELRKLDYTIAKIASTLNVSVSQVKLILKKAA
jgi:DNA invertase Pin-like site-specific DNA recombinase